MRAPAALVTHKKKLLFTTGFIAAYGIFVISYNAQQPAPLPRPTIPSVIPKLTHTSPEAEISSVVEFSPEALGQSSVLGVEAQADTSINRASSESQGTDNTAARPLRLLPNSQREGIQKLQDQLKKRQDENSLLR